MQIKLPAVYDISHYKEVPDFKLVSPKPVLFITKATEAYPGTIYYATDDKFLRFYQGMMELEVIRGAYHFHRKSLSPVLQAQHFVRTISQVDILPTDFLILDVEEGGETAAQLWAWLEYVKSHFPNNRLLMYSRKNILDPIKMTESEKAYFRDIPIWTAGYPTFPDLFSKVPSWYTPDTTKWGKTVLWQYGKGAVQGIQGDTDLNWIEQNFYENLGSNVVQGIQMASFSAKCNADAKVWKDVGLIQVGSVQSGATVRGDSEKVVSGVAYIHILSPLGWTKKQWFTVTYDTTPPPPPPPPTPAPTDYILYYSPSGTVRKFVPE